MSKCEVFMAGRSAMCRVNWGTSVGWTPPHHRVDHPIRETLTTVCVIHKRSRRSSTLLWGAPGCIVGAKTATGVWVE